MAQDVLADGFVSLCISQDANAFGKGCKILLEGEMTAEGKAEADKIVEVSGAKLVNAMFGSGSILAESLKTAFCACPSGQIFALPRKTAENAKYAEFSLKISTGPEGAIGNGRFMIYLNEAAYMVDLPVFIGDKAEDIAKALVEEISPDFPYAVKVEKIEEEGGKVPDKEKSALTVYAAVEDESAGEKTDEGEKPAEGGGEKEAGTAARIVFTAKMAGTNGNYFLPVYNWLNRPNIAAEGVSVEMEKASPVTVADNIPAKTDYANEVGECCYDCYILLSDDIKHQRQLRDHVRTAWSCDAGQCFGHIYTYNGGTLGAVAATGDNSAEMTRIPIKTECNLIFPWLLAANYGALSCCAACDSPELSVQGRENGLLSCVSQPQSCAACWTQEEQAHLRELGFAVISPSEIGSGGLTHPYVQNDVTNYLYDPQYRENATFRSVSSRRLAKAAALSIAKQLQSMNGHALYTKNTAIRSGTKGLTVPMILGRLRSWFKTNEGGLFSAADDLDRDLQVLTDFDLKPKCQGRPGKIYIILNYRPPERLESASVQLNPQMISNCDR